MKKILSIITTAILLAACTSDNEPGINTQPANFTIDTRGVTDNGTGYDINLNVSGKHYDYNLNVNGDGLTFTGPTIYIAPGTNTLPVYAWGVVKYDGTDMPIIHANPTTAVSWTDSNNDPSAPEIKLAFAPATARIGLKLTGATFGADPDKNKATLHGISAPKAGTFWKAGTTVPPTLDAADNTNTTTLFTGGDFVQVIPGTVAAGAHMLSITVDGTLHPVVATHAYTFLPGMDYTLKVTINADGQAVITDTAVQEFATGKTIMVGDETGKLRVIANEADLIAFREAWEASPNTKFHALQVANITLTKPWGRIGTYDNPFGGVYNGNGCSISGLKMEATGDYQGLFGYTKGAVLANITIKEPEVIGSNHNNIGALVGYALNTTISHCAVTGGKVEGNESVGGLVGQAEGTHIADCYTAGTEVGGNERVGGLVGHVLKSPIAACYAADATVTADKEDGGGLAGGNNGGSITFCYATGTVNGGPSYLGSLVGLSTRGTIASCYATGSSRLVGVSTPAPQHSCKGGDPDINNILKGYDKKTVTVWDATSADNRKDITIYNTVWKEVSGGNPVLDWEAGLKAP